MDQEKNLDSIQEFTLEFFKNLNCKINERKGVFTISNVPRDFETFVGKYSPYILVFDLEKHKEIENSEIMVKGSYILTAIRDYLRNKGQTNLFKLNIKIKEPSQEIKKDLKFNNCKLGDITKKQVFETLSRFTFFSNCQYLNEKQQFINSIYTMNNKLLDLNLDEYEIIEGNKDEIEVKNTTPEYIIAKFKLSDKIKKDISEMKELLKEKLNKRVNVLRELYRHQIKEKDEELEKYEEKVKISESELEHAYYDNDIKSLKNKIKKYKEYIDRLKKEGYQERLSKEEEFHVQDEIDKHSLIINNNLINISIFYYPSFLFVAQIKKDNTERDLNLSYNPILEELNLPSCDSCKNLTKEINLCSNGHISCNKCFKKCPDCKKELCNQCLEVTCNFCSKKICKDCAIKCPSCNKIYCKEDVKKCLVCDKVICLDCLEKCKSCGKMVCKDHFKKCPSCDREICEKCAKKDIEKCAFCSKKVCSDCLQRCKSCDRALCKDHVKKCYDCKSTICKDDLKECSICGKDFCSKDIKKCEGCNKLICKEDTIQCKGCGRKICKKCVIYKKAFLGLIEQQRCVNCVEK